MRTFWTGIRIGLVLLVAFGCREAPELASGDATIADAAADARAIDATVDARPPDPRWPADCPPAEQPEWVRAFREIPTCNDETIATDCAGTDGRDEFCSLGRCCQNGAHLAPCFECLSDHDCERGRCQEGECVTCWRDCDCRDRAGPFCVGVGSGYYANCAGCRNDDDCPPERPYCSYEDWECVAE